ncbi:hypothetical protein IMW82_12895 [Rhodanobacter sp. B2A1Ga4]|uniref:hypothetical protein n=1 Tax=Rhodanobacter sp. B2A1Ga4 TaxID=2778647 RepID=UPI001B395FA9|nr:hypothetical protein [Rhodanobacter sp. B2A1Ga4]MBQ4855568.1 hypothetical protein [Rhodanobacter sp. B2A1Ga4]
MYRLVASLPLALLLAACSPSPAPPPSGSTSQSTPTNVALGSPEWYAWVDRSLHIGDDGHGPEHGSDAWNRAVQDKLDQEAPQSKPGSPEWQQSVDALLRTRLRPS